MGSNGHSNYSLEFEGATGTVTGSRTLIQCNNKKYAVDFGMFQGPKEIREKNWSELKEAQNLSGIILTHAHIDHSGLLPKLVQAGFRKPIYCSPATKALCEVMLRDSAKLQEEDARFLNSKSLTHYSPALPLYTQDDVEKTLPLLQTVEEKKIVRLESDFEFCFHRAGHILGAMMVEMNLQGQRIIFSGDLGPQRPLLLKEAYRPQEADYLILESTYGDRCHERSDRKEQLGQIVSKIIGRGGTLVIPAFAVGRTQEIIYLLSLLARENKIPKVPIYLDSPMAQEATEIYNKFEDELRPEIKDGFFKNPLREDLGSQFRVHAVKSQDESMLLCMDTSPKIVISASGMLTGGRVLHHLRMRLPDEKSGVLFVGYQVPGTKGYLLRNGLANIRIHKQNVEVNAEILSMDSMSAHADHNDLMQWCKSFRTPPLLTVLNHGEDAARQALSYSLKNELGWKVHIPRENEIVSLNRLK